MGIIKEAAKEYFSLPIQMELIESEQGTERFHAAWRITYSPTDEQITSSPSSPIGRSSSNVMNVPSLDLDRLSDYNHNQSRRSTDDGTSRMVMLSGSHCGSTDTTTESQQQQQQQQPRCPFAHHHQGGGMTEQKTSSSSIPISHHPTSRHSMEMEVPGRCSPPITQQQQGGVTLNVQNFKRIFPFHVAINHHMQIIQVGSKLAHIFNHCLSQQPHIGQYFTLNHPSIASPWNWHELAKMQDIGVELT